jgi:hypothetical protein
MAGTWLAPRRGLMGGLARRGAGRGYADGDGLACGHAGIVARRAGLPGGQARRTRAASRCRELSLALANFEQAHRLRGTRNIGSFSTIA